MGKKILFFSIASVFLLTTLLWAEGTKEGAEAEKMSKVPLAGYFRSAVTLLCTARLSRRGSTLR